MIGGEFPIAITDFLNARVFLAKEPNVYTYSSGRAALYQILSFLHQKKGINHLLLPDYICGSVLVPVKALGFDCSFYPVDEQLELELSSFTKLYKKDSAVLVINYFGLKNLDSQIKVIRGFDDHAVIIEDDVQAYYEFLKPLGEVDFKFTSLRKTFAVPDGGLVKTKHKMLKVEAPNTFGQYKAAAALLKSMREGNFTDQIYLEMFEKGEDLIDDELEMGMSNIAQKLYSIIDEKTVKQSRIRNARYLVKRLNEIGIKPLLPLLDNCVPLFIPIRLNNRDKVRRKMFQNEVFCPIHWPLEGMDVKRGKEMAESELSLIIDQRYGQKEMDEIIKYIQ